MESIKTLFDKEPGGNMLIPELQKFYGGDLAFPVPSDRPYIVGNFVMTADGVVSFSDVPGHVGGGDVSRFNIQDKFVMGLLRTLADGVMVGAQTLRSEPDHVWTSEFIDPHDETLFQKQRLVMKKGKNPFNIFVTASGDINYSARVFREKDVTTLVMTTERGSRQALASYRKEKTSEKLLSLNKPTLCKETPKGQVDLTDMMGKLKREWGIDLLLIEGGPTFYGNLERAGLVDEVFLTVSPIVSGNAKASQRPTLSMMGSRGHDPEKAPYTEIVSVKQWGDYLFLRRRYRQG